jgi:hypothetical protein
MAERGAAAPCILPHMGSGCARCDRQADFTLSGVPVCWRHALLHGPMLRRSLLTALVVGTVLVAINQGNVLLDGDLPAALAWKIPLTYAVPFSVATWGALINSRP